MASDGLTGRGGLLVKEGLPGLGMGAGLEGSSPCAVLSFHHGEDCPCAGDIFMLLHNPSFGNTGGGKGVLVQEVPALLSGGGGWTPFGVAMVFWLPVVGYTGCTGWASGMGDNECCVSLGADGCCCGCETTGALGGCGLCWVPRGLDR